MRNVKLVSILLGFVLLLAACGGSGSLEPVSTPTPAAKKAVLEGTNELKFSPDSIEAKAGQAVEITLNNVSALEHNFIWEDTQEEVIVTQAGESKSTTRTFDKAGEYAFSCTIPSHKEAGMVGKVIVK